MHPAPAAISLLAVTTRGASSGSVVMAPFFLAGWRML
jgi:hypothetical protein